MGGSHPPSHLIHYPDLKDFQSFIDFSDIYMLTFGAKKGTRFLGGPILKHNVPQYYVGELAKMEGSALIERGLKEESRVICQTDNIYSFRIKILKTEF